MCRNAYYVPCLFIPVPVLILLRCYLPCVLTLSIQSYPILVIIQSFRMITFPLDKRYTNRLSLPLGPQVNRSCCNG